MIGTPRSLAALRWSPARMPRPPEYCGSTAVMPNSGREVADGARQRVAVLARPGALEPALAVEVGVEVGAARRRGARGSPRRRPARRSARAPRRRAAARGRARWPPTARGRPRRTGPASRGATTSAGSARGRSGPAASGGQDGADGESSDGAHARTVGHFLDRSKNIAAQASRDGSPPGGWCPWTELRTGSRRR